MNSLLLGIIIGILVDKLIYPVFEGISELICIKIEQWKNNIVTDINEKTKMSESEKRIIGFAPGGDEDGD